MKKRLIKTSVYRRDYFCEGSRPSLSTIRQWIEDDEIPGERIGKCYYVDLSKLEKSGNDLVDRVLAG